MSDIVERLVMSDIVEWLLEEAEFNQPRLEEAAAEIKRLRAENEQWRRYQTAAQYANDRQHAEIERLRLALDLTEGELKNSQIEIDQLQTDAAIAKAEGKS